jgi:hypothetical protein
MHLRTRWLGAFALLALASDAAAQVKLEWDQELQLAGGNRFGMGKLVAIPAGGWYVTGARLQYSFGAENWLPTETLLLRLDSTGSWTGTLSLATGGSIPLIAVDAAGGFSAAFIASGPQLKRFDAAGVQQMSVVLPSSMIELDDIGLTPSGDTLIGGSNSGFPSSAAVGSWSPTGVANFVDNLPNPNFNGSICTVSATGFVALARTGGPNPGQIDVVRPDGIVAWSTPVVPTLRLNGLSFTPAGELVAVGEDTSLGFTATVGKALKWSSTGTPSWTHTTAVQNSSFVSVAVAPGGRIAIAGTSNDFMTGASAALVGLLDADGTHRWTNSWTLSVHSSRHRFHQVLFDASGQIVVGGGASLNSPPLQGQLQGAPVIASWTQTGALSWQFVGIPYPSHNDETCTALQETSSGSFVYSSRSTDLQYSWPHPYSGRLLSIRPTSIAYCFGDGSGTACPCGNDATLGTGTGCLSSIGLGARLVSSGTASLTADTLVLQGSDMTATSPAMYFQGATRVNGGAGSVFGDGKLCATGSTMRLGAKINSAGASEFPAVGDPAIHVQGNITTSGVRTYQVLYRNTATFCTSALFNLTNGVEILWMP